MFFSHLRKSAAPVVAAEELPVTAHKDWQWDGTEQLAARDLLNELRDMTVEFSEENSLQWAITTFVLPLGNGTIELKVALTPDQDVEFAVGSLTTFSQKQAADWVEALRSQEIVF